MAAITDNNNNNRLFILVIFILICLWIVSITKSCERKPKPHNIINTVIRDSLIEVVKYRDSIRLQTVIKWRTLRVKPDSIPCDTFLNTVIMFCDTIIHVDSLEIAVLKDVVKEDSIIIDKLKERVINDSIEIVGVNKKLKRQKLFTKAAFFTGLIGGAAIMYRK